jgi:hypothetical protein
MLQNAAKHGKLMESYGNFGRAGWGAEGEGFSHESVQDDFLDYEECCKKRMMAVAPGPLDHS